MKARGLVGRAGMVICGGLPESEMHLLSSAVSLSPAEQTMFTTWTVPDSWDHTDSDTSRRGSDTSMQGAQDSEAAAHLRPGCGKFLVKVGGRPGIPVQVHLTAAEKSLKNTNSRWQEGLAQRRARTTNGSSAVRATASDSSS